MHSEHLKASKISKKKMRRWKKQGDKSIIRAAVFQRRLDKINKQMDELKVKGNL